MASQTLLKDLLEEDQEPFQLQSYISDLRCQINRSFHPVTDLQVKKRRPIAQNAGIPSRFCRNACFFSLRDSPNPTKSPLFEFRSPNRTPNAIFVNIPTRTAAILLEPAVRILKQSQDSKTRTRNAGKAFGIFGSVLKKLTQRKKRENRVSLVKKMLRLESPIVTKKAKREEEDFSQPQKIASETQFSRRSSSSGTVWSEKSLESSISCCSSQSDGLDQIDDELACGLIINGPDFLEDCDQRFCESPFHFVLQSVPSPSGFRTPNFSSPGASPRRDDQEMKKESYEVEKLKKLEMEEEEEEEEKEQSSPVSVLDPPFEDDDEDISITSTFRSVQRSKQELLQKICRFEKLAALDSVELERRMLEDEEEMINLYHCENITQRVLKTYFEELEGVPEDTEALISDLVVEEVQNGSVLTTIAKRVCEKLECWRDVESNTIDMMVEDDFRRESFGLWRSMNAAEVEEVAFDIEFAIFGDLVQELSQDIIAEF